MQRSVLAAAAALLASTTVGAALPPSEAERLAKAASIVQDIRNSIQQEYWNRARCVIAIPELKKAAFIVGGEYGKGVMSCRAGDSWSAPVFMQLAKGSWGFQAGAEQVDLVLLVMNEAGVQKLLGNKITLGADASVAAGPVGAAGHVGTDAALTAEILSYSRAKGLFAGINLSGGVLRPDEDANKLAYGPTASPRTILASREISAPPEAAPFLSALRATSAPTNTNASAAAATPAASTPATAQAGPAPTTDDDVRTQLTSIQQTLDRLLATAAPAPVGTTGSAAAPREGTVVVDRAALMQLRQQVEAAIAALRRR
jgi:lipid-binding SYLF domain-containing protein